jgi:hypothetical protein
MMALGTLRLQRCGMAVPGYHPACLLDDARGPDGNQVDVVGGWHDAGDLRKIVPTTAHRGLLAHR